MATGSVATIVYGETRLTHDIDLIVESRSADAEEIAEAFPSHTFYCPFMAPARRSRFFDPAFDTIGKIG